jgi:threonine synthase
MKYVSTRGQAPVLDFADVLLAGLAADGGLYVPESWPRLPAGWQEPRPYAELAAELIWPYAEGSAVPRPVLDDLVADAYATFDHPATVPLVEIEPGLCVAELFHGPTLAFKDVALQLVGRLFDWELQRRGERRTIVVATSGDTGSAAIAACVGRPTLDIVVLHPAGRVSDVQRRQMTTVDAPNVHNVAVEGTFDDCQHLLKQLFADRALRERVGLSAMNSINWARVAAQIVYHVVAAGAVGPCEVAVPTGNFGNVLAGWIARRSGAPIERLIIGSNRNDILTRWARTGALVRDEVVPTLSPSMDIQVSSNFERLLFEINGRDGGITAEQLQLFRATGRLSIEPDQQTQFIDGSFRAARFDDAATLAEMSRVYADTGLQIDPHTATATAAARRLGADHPIVTLSTAHPAKFPDAVEQATGVCPSLPSHLADLFDRSERTQTLPNDLATVEEFVRSVSRVPS